MNRILFCESKCKRSDFVNKKTWTERKTVKNGSFIVCLATKKKLKAQEELLIGTALIVSFFSSPFPFLALNKHHISILIYFAHFHYIHTFCSAVVWLDMAKSKSNRKHKKTEEIENSCRYLQADKNFSTSSQFMGHQA